MSVEGLPIELLPLILDHLIRPSHLANTCLVNKSFYTFSISLLYERVFIYAWHKAAKTKVIKLFTTLASVPYLAAFVHQLSQSNKYITIVCFFNCSTAIRDFPKALQSLVDHDELMKVCLQGLRNCVNLRSCSWTRDGSLTSDVLKQLQRCSKLEELEINGHDKHYDHQLLTQFTHLRKISLIMPSMSVTDILPSWTRLTANYLRHLSLICKSTSLVQDEVLETLAPNLANLEHFYLVGCPKVTHDGILKVLSASCRGVLGLGIEGLSATFNMSQFSSLCQKCKVLRRLQSITLTLHTQPSVNWTKDVVDLLVECPLQMFHISTIGGYTRQAISDEFCSQIVAIHGPRLTRFSVHRMRMSMRAIDEICRRCTKLKQLFIVIGQDSFDSLGPCLSQARSISAVHINNPPDVESDDVPTVSRERILAICRSCTWNLTQFGYNAHVWQVERTTKIEEDGGIGIELQLSSYESPEVPEQFLVVRT